MGAHVCNACRAHLLFLCFALDAQLYSMCCFQRLALLGFMARAWFALRTHIGIEMHLYPPRHPLLGVFLCSALLAVCTWGPAFARRQALPSLFGKSARVCGSSQASKAFGGGYRFDHVQGGEV
jgi:hypothetical protein